MSKSQHQMSGLTENRCKVTSLKGNNSAGGLCWINGTANLCNWFPWRNLVIIFFILWVYARYFWVLEKFEISIFIYIIKDVFISYLERCYYGFFLFPFSPIDDNTKKHLAIDWLAASTERKLCKHTHDLQATGELRSRIFCQSFWYLAWALLHLVTSKN